MPININQFDARALASLAGQNTGNLGLQSYGVDAGAGMQAQAEAFWKMQELKEKYAEQENRKQIQMLADKGYLTREQYKAAQEAIQKDLDRKAIERQNAISNSLEQQKVDQMGAYQQGTLGLQKEELGAKVNQFQAENALRQQEIGNTANYQKGTLGIQQQQVDIQKSTAEQEKMLNTYKMLMADKQEQRNLKGAYASAGMQIFGMTQDPKLREKGITSLLDNAIKDGVLTTDEADKMKAMPAEEQAMAFNALTNLVGQADIGYKKLTSAGQTIQSDGQGGFNIVPQQQQTDDNLQKEQYKYLYGEKGPIQERKGLDQFGESLSNAQATLQQVGADQLGPIKGLFSKYTSPEVQKLESNLNDLTLQYKNAKNMGSQGFTDKDREFVNAVNGRINQYKETLQYTLQRAQTMVEHAKVANWIEQNKIVKNSPSYNQWLQDNPPPDVMVQDKDGRKYHITAAEFASPEFKKSGYKQVE